jgi:hypothetical protein
VGESTVRTMFGGASDRRRTANATLLRVAFVHFEGFLSAKRPIRDQMTRKFTCQPGRFAVVSELPIKRLTRTTRNGESELAAEQGSFTLPLISYLVLGGEGSHRKGIT